MATPAPLPPPAGAPGASFALRKHLHAAAAAGRRGFRAHATPSSGGGGGEDFGLDAGWGVAVPEQPSAPSKAATAKKPGRKAAPAQGGKAAKAGKKGAAKQPYFSLSNEEGVLGLAMLQAKLAQQEGELPGPRAG
jgi:hypothetical protein